MFTQVGQRRIGCEAVQPGLEAALAGKRIYLAPDLDEHFLSSFLGGRTGARQTQAQAINHGQVLVIQPFERNLVFLLYQRNQRGFTVGQDNDVTKVVGGLNIQNSCSESKLVTCFDVVSVSKV